LKNNIKKKCKKIILKKSRFLWTFRGKPTLDPPGGRVNIMADGSFLATYLKKGVDYEFDIKTARFNYTSFQNVRFLELNLVGCSIIHPIQNPEKKVDFLILPLQYIFLPFL
jgi:hypothetical protein